MEVTRYPWIKQIENPMKAPYHSWLRFKCERCGGTFLGPPNPRAKGIVSFVRVHAKCPEKKGG